jgi:general secretion pathway protein G
MFTLIKTRSNRRQRIVRSQEAGFTLLELLVVIVILGLLATIAGPQVIAYMGRAKADTAKLQITQLQSSLDMFHLDVGRYPSQQEGILALVERPSNVEAWFGPYVKKKDNVVDPWGNPIHYANPGQHGEYDLYSLGADNADGGEEEDADVVSW